jgi:chromosome partitioning protein
MKILSLLAQKGGVGKTTLAVHLAVLASQKGQRVILVDTDPQKSTADWWEVREAHEPELVAIDAAQLSQVVKAAKKDSVDLVLVDTAPHAQAEAAVAAKLSDLVLIPTRPAILDLRAIGSTVEIAKAVSAKAAIVLNSCPPRRGTGEAAIVHEARKGLADYGLPIAPQAITQRAALSHALIDGRAVTEFEPKGKASTELESLWTWLQKEI